MTNSLVIKRPVIGWDNSLAGRNLTGTGVYAARLIAELKKCADVRMQVLNGWGSQRGGFGLVSKLMRNAADILWTHAGLSMQLRAAKCDLLHAPAYVAPLVPPCPMVVTVHDTIYLRFPEHYVTWWQRYVELIMPTVLARASAILAVSEQSKRDVIEAYGVAPEKVWVTYNGLDHSRFYPANTNGASEILRQYHLDEGYILHVGALVRRKNIPLLLRAVAILKERGRWSGRRVFLVGPAASGMPGAAEVAATIEQLGLKGDIAFAGHVPDDALPGLYAHASVVAVPSLYEGFCLPLVEAMAMGTPVVATAASCIPEILGDAGLLVPQDDAEALADALFAVMTSEALRADLRAKGFQRARDFSWNRTANETLAVYRDVLGSHSFNCEN